jgi:hypothetical protein
LAAGPRSPATLAKEARANAPKPAKKAAPPAHAQHSYTARKVSVPAHPSADCTPAHPDMLIIGGIGQAICWVAEGVGVTASKDPITHGAAGTDVQRVAAAADNVSHATADAAGKVGQVAKALDPGPPAPGGAPPTGGPFDLMQFVNQYGWIVLALLIVLLVVRHR